MSDLSCPDCGAGLEWGVDPKTGVEMTYCPRCDDGPGARGDADE
jgi:Zn-finger nucleic acid-binding protein